jgi:lysylphosphatidylglycerol synthetase-like protein (DUF2156 family)
VPDQQSAAPRQPAAMPTAMSEVRKQLGHSNSVGNQGDSAVAPEAAIAYRTRLGFAVVSGTAHRAARTERGFCMNLDGALQGRFPGIKLAIARDRSGRVAAFHRYATAGEGSEITLDAPFRRPCAPNGVDERLSVDMIADAKTRNALRLSLAFPAFRRFSRPPAVIRCSA